MRRFRATALLLAVLTAGVALWVAPSAGAGGTPTRIGVRGFEYGLTLSRNRVRPGPAIIEFQNYGEDPHDLKVQRIGGTAVYGVGEVAPGGVERLPQIRLRRASRYRLWCTLENHAKYGMDATLRVRRRRR